MNEGQGFNIKQCKLNVHHIGSKFSITNFTKKETAWFYFENETEGTMLFYLFLQRKIDTKFDGIDCRMFGSIRLKLSALSRLDQLFCLVRPQGSL